MPTPAKENNQLLHYLPAALSFMIHSCQSFLSFSNTGLASEEAMGSHWVLPCCKYATFCRFPSSGFLASFVPLRNRPLPTGWPPSVTRASVASFGAPLSSQTLNNWHTSAGIPSNGAGFHGICPLWSRTSLK